MVAQSGVVFSASMAAILANPVICFGSFTMTSSVPVTTTSSAVAGWAVTTSNATPVSVLVTETQPPKPMSLFREWSVSSA
jgi:hypothetical protein